MLFAIEFSISIGELGTTETVLAKGFARNKMDKKELDIILKEGEGACGEM